jgi:hypothetical protein
MDRKRKSDEAGVAALKVSEPRVADAENDENSSAFSTNLGDQAENDESSSAAVSTNLGSQAENDASSSADSTNVGGQAENDASSSAVSTNLGSQMEGEEDNRRQRELNDRIRALFRWRQAIDKADTGDTSGIIKLLHTHNPIPPECQSLLADLLERHQLKKKRGAPRRPIYESTPEERKLLKAGHCVRERQHGGATFDSAVDAVARERDIHPRKLSNFMQGKGSRRSRRFRP